MLAKKCQNMTKQQAKHIKEHDNGNDRPSRMQ